MLISITVLLPTFSRMMNPATQLFELRPYGTTDLMAYLRIRIIDQEFAEAFKIILQIDVSHVLVGIISLTFVVLNGADFPVVLIFGILVADIISVVMGNYLFNLSVELHLLSYEFIRISAKNCNGVSDFDSKFWEGMKPVRVEIGHVCSFETREFLLYIWGVVVISRIIDLLIAF